MNLRRTFGEKVFDTANVLILLAFVFITLYPFIYVLFASLSKPSLFMSHEGFLLRPLGFYTESYVMVFQNPIMVSGYLNTLFNVVVGTSLSLLLTTMGAYVLSKKAVLWGKAIVLFIVFTMFIKGGMIPFFLVVRGLGLYDNRLAMIIPYAISTYNMIIMRTYFAGIPDAIEESAKVDGAKDVTVLFKIILPMSMPIVAVMILLYGVYYWNSWFSAVMFIRRRELYPLQLVLREVLIQNDYASMTRGVGMSSSEYVALTVKYATIIVSIVPVLLIYPFLQKFFVKGIMIGALKG